MRSDELRALQGPLKQKYRDQPEAAIVTLAARSRIGEGISWPDESAPNPDRYVEFTVTPQSGVTLTADSVSLYLNGGGTGNMVASLYVDTDPAFASPDTLGEGVAASRDTLGYFAFAIDEAVAEGDTLYFRVYPYLPGGGSATKYIFLQDVTISGTTQGEAIIVDGVYWALDEDSLVTATGANLFGEGVTGTGVAIRSYSGTLQDGSEGPLGPFQRWWLGDGPAKEKGEP